MSSPTIHLGHDPGVHNLDPEATAERIRRGKAYRDLSTVCVIPTRGSIDARVVESWWGLMTPMNQPFIRMFIRGMEVGDAYNAAIETILEHPVLSEWKYVLTLEEDNMPPPDGLLKLYESIDDYACIGGLYYTKGPEGQAMIYGKPGQVPAMAPQIPEPETVVPCNGLGMGFSLFPIALFRDEKIPRPWFKTLQEVGPEGARAATQDLYFFENARKAGHRVACDTRVRVAHLDVATGIPW